MDQQAQDDKSYWDRWKKIRARNLRVGNPRAPSSDGDSRPILIFDSGAGGLNTANALMRNPDLKHERIISVSDLAHFPYGTKAKQDVLRYSREIVADAMRKYNPKAIVIGCNTATAAALEQISAHFDVPVVGVIPPGAENALAASENKKIGVIGTQGTLDSGIYQNALREQGAQVITQAVPDFVKLVEGDRVGSELSRQVVREGLEKMSKSGIDTLILACTHFTRLKQLIGEVMGPSVTLIDPSDATANVVADLLTERGELSRESHPVHTFFATDNPGSLNDVAEQIFGYPVPIKKMTPDPLTS